MRKILGFLGVLAAALLVGCNPKSQEVAKNPAADAAHEVKLAAVAEQGSGGSISPIENYKQERLNKALRGLDYGTGRVTFGADWREVEAEIAPEATAASLVVEGGTNLESSLFVEAIASFTHAVIRDPGSVEAYRGLAKALIGKGKTEFAHAAMETALDIAPTDAELLFELGLNYQRESDLEAAIATWNRLLDVQPQHAAAHERLAIAHYYLNEFDAAWTHVHAAEALGHAVPPQFRPLLEAKLAEPVQ